MNFIPHPMMPCPHFQKNTFAMISDESRATLECACRHFSYFVWRSVRRQRKRTSYKANKKKNNSVFPNRNSLMYFSNYLLQQLCVQHLKTSAPPQHPPTSTQPAVSHHLWNEANLFCHQVSTCGRCGRGGACGVTERKGRERKKWGQVQQTAES